MKPLRENNVANITRQIMGTPPRRLCVLCNTECANDEERSACESVCLEKLCKGVECEAGDCLTASRSIVSKLGSETARVVTGTVSGPSVEMSHAVAEVEVGGGGVCWIDATAHQLRDELGIDGVSDRMLFFRPVDDGLFHRIVRFEGGFVMRMEK